MPAVPPWIPERLGYRIERAFSAPHKAIFRATGGRLGARLEGGDILLLTTVGRRSGRPRTTPLTYLRHVDQIVVVASNAGFSFHPGWFHNALASPDVKVRIRSETHRARARPATAAERAELWPRILESMPVQRVNTARTAREIPLMILTIHDQ
jgi:deazaflavin-dependent oxidoreductase (nitroreductase family)